MDWLPQKTGEGGRGRGKGDSQKGNEGMTVKLSDETKKEWSEGFFF